MEDSVYREHDLSGTGWPATGEPAKASERGEQALAEFRAIGDRRLEAISLETIARAESEGGNLPDARRHMEEALTVSESSRQGTDSQQLRASFFATRQDGYNFYIDLLMRTGAEALALETSERSRARSLLEMLNGSATDIHQGVDPKLLERERDLSNRLNAKGFAAAAAERDQSTGGGSDAGDSRSGKRIPGCAGGHPQEQPSLRGAHPAQRADREPDSSRCSG